MTDPASRLSQHPVDRLIRELIQTGRLASATEIARIVERIATAPFNSSIESVPRRQRGLAYAGRTLGMRAEALFLHLVERVVTDKQWAASTTPDQYLDDLRAGVRWPDARLAAHFRRGGFVVAAVSRTADIVLGRRLGPDSLPWLIVIYSTDRGILLSGYQFSTLDQVSISEDARWLK